MCKQAYGIEELTVSTSIVVMAVQLALRAAATALEEFKWRHAAYPYDTEPDAEASYLYDTESDAA